MNKDSSLWGLAIAVIIAAVAFYNATKLETSARVEVHHMWSDALRQSVETVCDRFLVLEVNEMEEKK